MIVVLSLFHIWLCQKLILNPIFHSQYKNVMELSNDVKKTLNICENISSIIILKLNTPSIFILGKKVLWKLWR